MYWPLQYSMPLLKTLQLSSKAFRIKSDLFILLYKTPQHPASPLLGHQDPLAVSQSCTLPLQPRWGQVLLVPQGPPLSCLAGLLFPLRSQVKCCFFREPLSTIPQRMVHLACPFQSTWLSWQSFDKVVLWTVFHQPPRWCGKSVKTEVLCILLWTSQAALVLKNCPPVQET